MKRVYRVEDYIGKKFGKWTILEDAPKKYNLTRVKCKCEYGLIILKIFMIGL